MSIQLELKQKVSTLEDENKDLRLRLLAGRKRCTRILHKSPSPLESAPVPAANTSDDFYAGDAVVTDDDSPVLPRFMFDFHPQPTKREAIALPLSLSAVMQANAAAAATVHLARTNFPPLPAAAQVSVVPPQKSTYVDTRMDSLRLKRSVSLPVVPDRVLRIPKEQVDFVMIEDVVVESSVESPVVAAREPTDAAPSTPSKNFFSSIGRFQLIDWLIDRVQKSNLDREWEKFWEKISFFLCSVRDWKGGLGAG